MKWPTKRLAEVCSIKTGKLDSNEAVAGGEYPFFTCAPETLQINRFSFDTEAVLLAGNNAAGVYPLKYYEGKFDAYQRTYVLESLDKNNLNTRFLYYSLNLLLEHFQSVSIGAATQYLTKAILNNLPISIPVVAVQNKIANVLFAYDELIENNRRRMQLLEESARLLYREWFVHLRFPGHEHTKISHGLPHGWGKKRMDALAEIKGGKQISNELILDEGKHPVFGGNGIQGFTEGMTHEGFVIAFGRVGANCGSIHWAYQGAWINNNASGLVPHSHPEVLLHHLLNFDFSNLRKGAAQPFIPNGVLSTVEFLDAPTQLKDDFCDFVRPIRLQQVMLERQTQKLRAARDLLLPRLMSGEIAV